jgi:hypothetical protein
VQFEEGLAVATAVEDSGAPPPPKTVAVIEEGRTVTEKTAAQAVLETPAGTGPSGVDVVMVPVDDDSAPPPPTGDRDVATSMVPEPSPAAGAA